jgi:PAS domain S-box-containing protein
MKSMSSTGKRMNEEEILEILVEQAPVGVCIMQDGKFCYVNSNFPVAIGYTVDELIGKDSLEIVIPEDREMVRENTIKMLKEEVLVPYQFRVTCKDGSIIWVMATVKSIQYHGRQAVLGNYMEITGRKQIEEALKKNEQSYRELSNSITDVFFAMDEHLRYTYWNKASEVLTGIRAEDALGKSIREIFPDKPWRRRAAKVYRDVLRTKQPQTFVTDYDIDDRQYIFEISAYPSRGGISVFVRDITGRIQAEKARREAEEEKSAFLEEAPVGIIHTDLKGKITYVNKRLELESGYSRREIIGKSGLQLNWFPASTTKYFSERMAARLRGSPAKHWETQFKCKDGRWIWIELEGKILRKSRVPVGFQIIATNITDRKRAEEALQAEKNKLESIIDALEDTLSILDKDFNILYQSKPVSITGRYHLGEKCYRAYEGKDKVCDGCAVAKAFKDGKSHTSEKEIVMPSGEARLLEKTANPIRDAKGKVVSCVEVARDITERKRAEETLQAESNKLQSLIDAMEDGLTIQDKDYKIIYESRLQRTIFGDRVGEKCYRVYEGREKICEGCPVKKAFKDGKSHTAERRMVMPSGEVAFWENTANPIRNAGGEIVSCLEISRDITERKKQEQALADEATRRRLLIDQSLDGIVVLDEDARVCEANQRFGEMLGYTHEEILKLHTWDWDKNFPPEQILEMGRNVDEKGLQLETKHTRKDGSVFDVDISINGTMCGGQKLIFCVCRDITERKKSEEQLRESEQYLKTLFNASGGGILVIDPETHDIVDANYTVIKMIGTERDQIIGRMCHKFVCPAEVGKCPITDLGQKIDSSECILLKANSKSMPIIKSVVPIMRHGRQYLLELIVDITERKQAVEALKQSEERYRTILEEMEDAYFEVDLGGHINFVNNSVCRDLGYSREELIGMSYKSFTVEEDIESVFQVFNEVYQTGAPNKGFPWRTIRKDGVQGFAETSVSPLRNNKGEIIGFRGVGRDITERKQTEEKLQQSRENYRALFDSSVIGALVLDAETMKVVMANEAAMKIFGFNSETTGVNPIDFVPPENREKNLELIVKEVFEKNSREAIDLPAVTKDGRKIWVNATGARIMHKGRLAGLFSFTDITERKQAEEALRQSEENYKTLFNSAVIGMYVMDAETFKVVMGNRAAREIVGFGSAEEGIGVNPFDFVVPEDREKVLEIAINEFLQDSRKTHEIQVIDKNGQRRWQSISIARIMHKGRLASLVSFTDITERKRMEEALRQGEENYRALFDNSVIGTFVLDAETMKIVVINRAATEIFGFSSVEEAIGINPLDLIPPENKDMVLDIVKKELFEQDLRQTNEVCAMTKDGREIWISITAARIMHEGRLAALVSFTDITEQRKQRERLMMTDRLASIGELASGAAHELNNPLTSIIGFSQLLMEKKVPDDIREDLKLINNEAQRAAVVTNNLLAFARKHAPMKQPNQINNIIEDVLELRAREHKVNQIDVNKHLAPNLPEIMVDYFQMQQVFMNTIINAEYFMTKAHNGGTLTITTQRENDTVRISFADDGPGIPTENLVRVFDPFFTTKEAGKGTGLGLSICHGIVTEHGGQIYVRSQLGKGATFVVELPIKKRAQIKSTL